MVLLGGVGRLPQLSGRQSAEVYFAASALTCIASGMFSAGSHLSIFQTDCKSLAMNTLMMLYFNVGTSHIELRETNSSEVDGLHWPRVLWLLCNIVCQNHSN